AGRGSSRVGGGGAEAWAAFAARGDALNQLRGLAGAGSGSPVDGRVADGLPSTGGRLASSPRNAPEEPWGRSAAGAHARGRRATRPGDFPGGGTAALQHARFHDAAHLPPSPANPVNSRFPVRPAH